MPIPQHHFDLIREYIRKECALEINNDKKYLIESRLSPLVTQSGAKDFHEFCLKAKNDPSKALRNKIVDSITTHETLWFRDMGPWKAMMDVVLPKFAEQLSSRKKNKIRIWSSACSTGQEPYSLAILIDDQIRQGKLGAIKPESFEIIASDISAGSVDTAKKACYNQLEMNRGLKPEQRERYFTQKDSSYQLNDKIRRRVNFKIFNLQDSYNILGKMDLILCRNVLIYFSDDFKRDVIHRFALNLNPEGYFFLGSTEAGLGYTDDYKMQSHNNALFYQIKD